MKFEDWNLNKSDRIYIIIAFIVAFLSIAKMMQFSLSGGILNPDISLYLLSALKYSGMDYFNVVYPEDLFYTPIISFLTSLIFRMGYVDKNAIIIVTGIFCFLGYIGFYILLRNRFDPLLSLTGVIIYGSLSVVIFNLAKGLIDLPAISISIWVLVFAIIAVDKNSKYFLIVFPLLVIGFFTKYIVGFMLPLIVLYYVMNRNIVDTFDCLLSDRLSFKQKMLDYIRSDEFKYIFISIIFGLILATIISKFLILDYGGSLTFFEQSVNTFNGHSNSIGGINYDPQKSYYLKEFTNILFEKQSFGNIFSYILYSIIGFASILNVFNIFKNIQQFKSDKKHFKTKFLEKALIIIFVLLMVVTFLTFKLYPNHMISNISFLISMTILYSLLQKYNVDNRNLSLDILFLAYFVINFTFISLFQIKVYRYALPLIPPFIYFVIWGLDSILNYKKVLYLNKQDKQKYPKAFKLIPVILIVLFLFTTVTFMQPLEIERTNDVHIDVLYKGFVNDLKDVCDYINGTDDDYHSKSFASYYHHSRTIRWYLGVNVTVLSEKDSNLSDFNQTDYIILNENKTFKNYHEVFNKGDFFLYSLDD